MLNYNQLGLIYIYISSIYIFQNNLQFNLVFLLFFFFPIFGMVIKLGSLIHL